LKDPNNWGMVVCSCNPSYGVKCKKKYHIPGWSGQNIKPHLKNNLAKRAEDVAQVVEYLTNRHKTSSSNLSTAK
jgi:hypothetical protein